MKKFLGYLLISLGIVGIICTVVALAYVLFLLFFFCHISYCWPQFIFFPVGAIVVIIGFAIVIRAGKKILKGKRNI